MTTIGQEGNRITQQLNKKEQNFSFQIQKLHIPNSSLQFQVTFSPNFANTFALSKITQHFHVFLKTQNLSWSGRNNIFIDSPSHKKGEREEIFQKPDMSAQSFRFLPLLSIWVVDKGPYLKIPIQTKGFKGSPILVIDFVC